MKKKKAYQNFIDRPVKPKTYRVKAENEAKIESKRRKIDVDYPHTGISNADILNIIVRKKIDEISELEIVEEKIREKSEKNKKD